MTLLGALMLLSLCVAQQHIVRYRIIVDYKKRTNEFNSASIDRIIGDLQIDMRNAGFKNRPSENITFQNNMHRMSE